MVRLKPARKFVVRVTFHWDATNQFSDEVLAIKPALPSALVDADFLNCSFYFLAGDDFTFSPIFGRCEFHDTDFLALLPLAICLFSDITDFPCDHVSTLQQSLRICG